MDESFYNYTPPCEPTSCATAWLYRGCARIKHLRIKCHLQTLIHVEVIKRWVGVETQGKYTQGMTVIDCYNLTGKTPNATVMLDVDRQAFLDLLAERLTFMHKSLYTPAGAAPAGK